MKSLLNSRLAPDSYLGVAHFSDPQGGPAEPVVVMRRYPDSCRLATAGAETVSRSHDHLVSVAETLARFHEWRGPGSGDRRLWHRRRDRCAVASQPRWSFSATPTPYWPVTRSDEVQRLAKQFIDGRAVLFAQRITDRRIVDGHADLLADDIFCMPGGPVVLDCLEFDDDLRYVDGIDDAAFLAMDLEFLGRKDLGEFFLERYRQLAGDNAPPALMDFYIAYRAVVRAKVDCVRFAQGRHEAAADARRHLDIALDHLRAGTVRLVLIGGGPGTGKTTLAHALAEQIRAQVISTDDVRRQLQQEGVIGGTAGVLDAGLYTPENVSAVYDEVLRRAHLYWVAAQSVILDGTWRDTRQRQRARELADETVLADNRIHLHGAAPRGLGQNPAQVVRRLRTQPRNRRRAGRTQRWVARRSSDRHWPSVSGLRRRGAENMLSRFLIHPISVRRTPS